MIRGPDIHIFKRGQTSATWLSSFFFPMRARTPGPAHLLVALLCALSAAWADSVDVNMVQTDRGHVFRLAPFSKGLLPPAEAMRVYVAEGRGAESDLPPLLGSYDIHGNVLTFVPRFPLQAGRRYRVVFDTGMGSGSRERTFDVPETDNSAPTVVEEVYPTSDLLPENQLKFYLRFSAPMSRGEAYLRVHLLDESGKRIALPFLELDQELWDPPEGG